MSETLTFEERVQQADDAVDMAKAELLGIARRLGSVHTTAKRIIENREDLVKATQKLEDVEKERRQFHEAERLAKLLDGLMPDVGGFRWEVQEIRYRQATIIGTSPDHEGVEIKIETSDRSYRGDAMLIYPVDGKRFAATDHLEGDSLRERMEGALALYERVRNVARSYDRGVFEIRQSFGGTPPSVHLAKDGEITGPGEGKPSVSCENPDPILVAQTTKDWNRQEWARRRCGTCVKREEVRARKAKEAADKLAQDTWDDLKSKQTDEDAAPAE